MTIPTQSALVPPFTQETAAKMVRKAEDGWNSRDPGRVSLVYTPDSKWRNRAEFVTGREQIVEFLTRKWRKELDYRLSKSSGRLATSGSPSASLTSGTMTQATGIAPTETKTGSSTPKASCTIVMPVSTICRSRSPTDCIIGHWDVGLTITTG